MKGRRLPAAICLGFALIGVAMIVAGPAENRVIGAMSVLFFGLGGLALMLPLLSRAGQGAVRVVDVGAERGFLFPIGRAKRMVVIVAGAGMTAGSVLIGVLANPIVGVLGALVFGFFTIYALVTLGRAQGLALTPTRIVVRGAGGGELAWDAVDGVGIVEHARTRYIGIDAADRSLVRRVGRGWLARLNYKLVPIDLLVSADHLAGPPEQALAALVGYLEDPARRAAIGTEQELSRLTDDAQLR